MFWAYKLILILILLLTNFSLAYENYEQIQKECKKAELKPGYEEVCADFYYYENICKTKNIIEKIKSGVNPKYYEQEYGFIWSKR